MSKKKIFFLGIVLSSFILVVIFLGIVLFSFILVVIGATVNPPQPSLQPAQEAPEEQPKEEEGAKEAPAQPPAQPPVKEPEPFIDEVIIGRLERLGDFAFAVIRNKTSGRELDIHFNMSRTCPILGAQKFIPQALFLTLPLAEEFFGNTTYNISEIRFYANTTFYDKYQREYSQVGTRYTLTRETASKINWDNWGYFLVDWKGFLQAVADDHYIHPSIRAGSCEIR